VLTGFVSPENTEPFGKPVLNIVDGRALYKAARPGFYQDIDAVCLYRFFVFFRFIQNQSQFGTASANPLHIQSQVLPFILVEQFPDFFFRPVGDIHHTHLTISIKR